MINRMKIKHQISDAIESNSANKIMRKLCNCFITREIRNSLQNFEKRRMRATPAAALRASSDVVEDKSAMESATNALSKRFHFHISPKMKPLRSETSRQSNSKMKKIEKAISTLSSHVTCCPLNTVTCKSTSAANPVKNACKMIIEDTISWKVLECTKSYPGPLSFSARSHTMFHKAHMLDKCNLPNMYSACDCCIPSVFHTTRSAE
mmetsp:Transcript_47376/g.144144  ORF Transcript_47376/g.144144 Transcript_47376/m.144144 type:complete len:207 (+) Transcript_47376:873-1493(+)